jgi:hypothetical protein
VDEAIMSMTAQAPADAMSWYRDTLFRARTLVRTRWIPDYVDVDHLAIALLVPPPDDVADLLRRYDVDAMRLVTLLVRSCDSWLKEQGLELGFGNEQAGGGAPTPRLTATLRSLCPDGDGCGRCIFSAVDLFVALTRVPNSYLRAALGEELAGVLAALPVPAACGRGRA